MNLLKWLFGNSKNISSEELTHVNQEMYKKNVELSDKNKTLSLLRKIDEIILSAATDVHQVAQRVADAAAIDAGFSAVVIYLAEKPGFLSIAALSKTNVINTLAEHFNNTVFQDNIPLSDEKSILTKVFKEQEIRMIQGIQSLLAPSVREGIANYPDSLNDIQTAFICPLKIRNKGLGVLVVGVKENGDNLSQFQIDLVERLSSVIGIAIDNALLYQEIRDANENLKQLDVLKDEFVSLASHELRTPMTAIKSYLWMALSGQGGALTEKEKYYLQRSYNSVDRLIKLVNDMLNISRIESGRLTINIKSVDMNQLVSEVIEEISPRAKELGVNIDINEQGSIPQVLADPDKIKEVVYNLVGNSLKFTPKDGKITISFIQKDTMLETQVHDTGSGIEVEDIPKLFHKFGMLPGTYVANQPASGTGLGLYITKSIVELHEGKIWVTSEGRDKGTTFTFSLKVFNQHDLDKFNEKYKKDSQAPVELIHQKII